MSETEYERGLRDGEIKALGIRIDEQTRRNNDQDARMNWHAKRLRAQERISYGLLGAILLVELMPMLRGLFS